jgi:hypothetical protein
VPAGPWDAEQSVLTPPAATTAAEPALRNQVSLCFTHLLAERIQAGVSTQ